MTKRMKFSDQIRQAIDASGMTRYAICKRLKFSESVMSKFMASKCNLSMDTLDRLADLLRMNVVVEGKSADEANTRRKSK